MREKILQMLENSNKSLTIEEIDTLLNISSIEETKELVKTINKMEQEGEVYRTHKNKYMPFARSPFKQGILRMNKKGFGFVDMGNDDDVFINRDNIRDALDGDTVIIEITEVKKDGRREGRILKIAKRNIKNIVGEIYFKKGKAYVTPDDKKLNMIIEIEKNKHMGTVDGNKVVVNVNPEGKNGVFKGEVTKVLGHKNDPGVDILSIVYKYDLKDTFDEETINELDNIPEEVKEEEKVGRRDLTKEMIFTIDGSDTKDIDDAISVDKLENGNYKLGVHIADVSYYVREGSAIDKEAMERGTSVYLVDRVIPMLPHKLSNGICSLNPNVERLAMSCVMEINSKGETVDYEIFESVIKSRIQMNYKNVNEILEHDNIPEGYEPYSDKLKEMLELSHIIRKARDDRGNLDFAVDEAKILVDEACHPTAIVLRERGEGEKMIEDFMIQANETVARHIFYMELPFIYRVHEEPKEDKIRGFLGTLSTMGYHLEGDIKDLKPKTIQRLLNFLKTTKEFKILSSQLLRNMQKAVYLPKNLGHYGLASSCYTHFTSPIRRYPDTTVHRLLRTYMFQHKLDEETIKHWEAKLPLIAEHSSHQERESVDCEREVESMKMAEYMEDHIGEEFTGMISSITNFGMFVELDNMVEGLIRLEDMKDFYIYDETKQTLTGEKTKKKYTLGDIIKVKVERASKEEKQIDFSIVEVKKEKIDKKKKSSKNK